MTALESCALIPKLSFLVFVSLFVFCFFWFVLLCFVFVLLVCLDLPELVLGIFCCCMLELEHLCWLRGGMYVVAALEW